MKGGQESGWEGKERGGEGGKGEKSGKGERGIGMDRARNVRWPRHMLLPGESR